MKNDFYRKKRQAAARNKARRELDDLGAAVDSLEAAMALVDSLSECVGNLYAAREKLQQMRKEKGGVFDE